MTSELSYPNLSRGTHQSIGPGTTSLVEARQTNDFASFAPHLKTLFALKREQAQAQGFQKHIYDALLDDFEPNMTSAEVAKVTG